MLATWHCKYILPLSTNMEHSEARGAACIFFATLGLHGNEGQPLWGYWQTSNTKGQPFEDGLLRFKPMTPKGRKSEVAYVACHFWLKLFGGGRFLLPDLPVCPLGDFFPVSKLPTASSNAVG